LRFFYEENGKENRKPPKRKIVKIMTNKCKKHQ